MVVNLLVSPLANISTINPMRKSKQILANATKEIVIILNKN